MLYTKNELARWKTNFSKILCRHCEVFQPKKRCQMKGSVKPPVMNN